MQLRYWGLLVGLWHLPADQQLLKDWSNKSCLLAKLQQENMTVCLTWLSDHPEKEKKSSIVRYLCYRDTITVNRCSYIWFFGHCRPFQLLVFEGGIGVWTTKPYNISEKTYFFGNLSFKGASVPQIQTNLSLYCCRPGNTFITEVGKGVKNVWQEVLFLGLCARR